MARAVVLTGGGIQGAAAAASVADDHELTLVHVNYGQHAAASELNATEGLASSLRAARVLSLTMPHVKELNDRLGTGNLVGAGKAAGPRKAVGRRDAVEPATRRAGASRREVLSPASLRGLIPVLLSVGAQCCLRIGAKVLVTGLSRFCSAEHLGVFESDGKPDRLHEFLHSFDIMLESLSVRKPNVAIEAPLADLSYEQVIRLAGRLGVPFELTWTCERGGSRVCGRCRPCRARAAAFVEAVMTDPLVSTQPASA